MTTHGNKIADLYVRVSTDEQADKGYSQRNQEEMLRKYCVNHAIEIRDVIYEDHSAKSFNRPQWKKLISHLRKKRNCVNLILFTKWDRFSRNAGDAYQMINTLRQLGAEPQAIEQPLDLSIPENKMMLAFYLAAPEVENDRRSLNVFYGMRRAKKEGRYMGMAPVAYGNRVDENGKKYIAPKEPDASLVRWAFEQLAKGKFNTEQIYKQAKIKGLKCSKAAFWSLIRNPLYCGKIFIPAFDDEQGCFVRGQHEPIIPEELFDKVQTVIDGRSRTYRNKIETADEFPLRGFFVCPKCGKVLTASKSKGRNSYYAYYHCYKECTYRISTKKLHEAFQNELSLYIPREKFFELYKAILKETYMLCTAALQAEKKKLQGQLKDYQARITNISDLLATRQLEAADYAEMKNRYSQLITELKGNLKTLEINVPSFDGLLRQGVEPLLRLDKLLESSSLDQVRMLIGLLFPQMLHITYDGIGQTGEHHYIYHLYDRE